MSAKRHRAVFWFGVALGVIVLLAAAPVITVFLAAGIADALNCTLNEGGGSSCSLMGIDLGGTLSAMFIFGWLAIDTLPLGAVALLVWLVAAVITFIVSRYRRRRRAAA